MQEQLLRSGLPNDFEEVMNYREFLIVFYGASWLPKSLQVARAINQFMHSNNPDDDGAI